MLTWRCIGHVPQLLAKSAPATPKTTYSVQKQEHLISYHIHSYFISYTPAKAIPMGHLPRLGYR